MNFNTWGPFECHVQNKPHWKSEFWEEVTLMEANCGLDGGALRSAIGCYLFTTRRGDKYTPWYVGKTLAQAGFEGEIFQQHKLNHYNAALSDVGQKKGQIFLFALINVGPGESWSFSRGYKTSKRTIDWLEKTMMGMALRKNINLRNLRDTTLLKNVWVEGVFNDTRQGAPSKTAREVKKALLR
jgi:hypothetical protein